MKHITFLNWIKPVILSRKVENNTLKLKIDWSGGFKTNINHSEITKQNNGYQYKDDSIKLKKYFNSLESLLWEFEFPKTLENDLNKLK